MSRGQYPQRVSYGWNYHDAPGYKDPASPESKPSQSATSEDDYSDESKP